MVRSIWVGALVAALTSAGLASAQPAGAPRPGSAVGRVLMINEPGQPPQKCRVVREWTLPDGDKAMEAEDVATGQKITLVTPAPDGRSKTVAARFFHWGKDGTPPRGTPLPPPTAFAQGTPALPPAALTAGPPPAATAQTAASGQKLPLSLAPQTTTAGNAWPPAFGGSGPAAATAAAPAPPPASSYQAKPVPPAIITTSATSPAPAAAPPTPVTTTPAPVAAAPTPASSYQTAPAPAPPTMVVTPPPAGRLCPVPSTCCPPCGTNRGCPRNTCCPPTVVSGPPVIINTQPAPTTPASQPVGLPVVSTVPAQPGDWRRSWGASRDPKPAADGSPVITQTASVKADEPPRRAISRLDLSRLGGRKTDATKAELPQADRSKPDPFRDPAAYTRTPVEQKAEDKMKVPQALAARPAPPAVTPAPAAPASSLQSTLGRGELPPGPGAALPPAAAPQGMPLGAQSVLAAGDPRYVPVPIVTLPDARRNPAPPPVRMPEAPQPNKALLENAFRTAANSPPPAGMALDKSGGNAFSPPPPPPDERESESAFGQQTTPPRGMMGPRPPLPPAPFAPAGQPMAYRPGPGAYATAYGPAFVPTGYSVPPPPAWRPAAPPPGMAQAPPQAPPQAGPDTREALGTLQDSLYPSQREYAAEQLGKVDWRTNGAVVDALVKAAKEDPAASVRACCVRVLAKMNVNTVPVVSAVQSLKSDMDPRVQTAAQEALAKLAPGQAAGTSRATDGAVQPAGATAPVKPE